ncbi:MAG: hypothetical protein CMB83_00855 [Flammeovirgaceae bacterium]|nr:hypothetical protein [Flammeovirgaceae bacterium]|tara:strand:+ start:798 stop:1676 length:879 start_codon:yes stop_codon:yes gene_type:complete
MDSTNPKKNYLVILAGSPRGGEKTWHSLYRYVLEPLNADLALCTSDKWNQDISLFKKAKYKWVFKEFENYLDYYNENFDGSWEKYFLTGKDTGLYSSGLIHFVFKDIIKNNYLNILKEYKYIVYTRFDQFYLDIHPEIKNDEILIPEGEDYSGICDRHAAFPSEYAEKFLSICDYVDDINSLNDIPDFNNCEVTFMNHMESTGFLKKIVRTQRTQFTASLKGEHTNWRTAKYPIYFYKNLMTKYPDEFIDGVENSINKSSLFKFFSREPIMTLNFYYLLSRRIVGRIKSVFK